MHLAKAKIFLKKNSFLPERGRSTGRGGFTLMELMMAIGILGIGMVMAASVFPAALKENQLSNDDVIGEMICKNGLNMGKIHYTVATVTSTTFDTEVVEAAYGNYPIGPDNTSLGYALLARKIDDDPDCQNEGYQLVCAAYRKRGGVDKTIFWSSVTVNSVQVVDSVSVVTVTESLRVGSPFILRGTGEYATITKVDGSTATLNCKLEGIAVGNEAYLLFEQDESEYSPAIFVMSTRTGLSE